MVAGVVQLMILRAILVLRDNAYALRIEDEVEKMGRRLKLGQSYRALKQLERGGLVTSKVRRRKANEQGQPRRIYCVTDRGIRSLQTSGMSESTTREGAIK
jgi:DNA-binding PadR family transcriptional regulator